MLIRNWMSTNLVTVDPETSMVDAANLLKEHNIRRLLVTKKDKLVGIVADVDIKEASPSDATSLSIHEIMYLLTKIKVKELMKKPITINEDQTIEEAAVVMLKNKIASLPVLDNKKLVGIITESDIFKALITLTGVHQGGIHFAFELADKPGSIKEVADVIRSHGGQMVSILTSYEEAREGFRRVYIRMKSLDRRKMKALEEELSSKFHLLYVKAPRKR